MKIYARIYREFQDNVRNIFGNNLVFGFISGSVASQAARFGGPSPSDLDTFICLNKKNPDQEKQFLDWSISTQLKYNLHPDCKYPLEIVALSTLKEILSGSNITIKLCHNSADVYDKVIWSHILSAQKASVIDDKEVLQHLTHSAKQTIRKFYNQVQRQLYEVCQAITENQDFSKDSCTPLFCIEPSLVLDLEPDKLFKKYIPFDEDYTKFDYNLTGTYCEIKPI